MSTPMEVDEVPPNQEQEQEQSTALTKGKAKAADSSDKKRFEVKKV